MIKYNKLLLTAAMVIMMGAVGCGENNENAGTSEQGSTATTESASATEVAASSVIVNFKVNYDKGGMEYGQMYAFDSNGTVLWEITTSKAPAAQLNYVGAVGPWNNLYFYTEGKELVAVDIVTGEEQWRNDEFGGYRTNRNDALIDVNGNVYVTGGMGPDLFVCDSGGATVYYVKDCGLDIAFPAIELVEPGKVKISGYNNTSDSADKKEMIIDIYEGR